MAAPKGHPRYGGRAAGSPNKLTAHVKAALEAAFDKLGGIDSLVSWGQENRTEFYKLWIKLLPTQITGADGGPVEFSDNLSDADILDRLRKRAERIRGLATAAGVGSLVNGEAEGAAVSNQS